MATPAPKKKDNGHAEITVTVEVTVAELIALVRTTMTPTGLDEPPGTTNAARRAVTKMREAARKALVRNNYRIPPSA